MGAGQAATSDVLRRVGPTVAAAPLTYGWLALLFGTTRIQRSASARKRRELLREQSTNIVQLRRRPLRALVTSLLWLDGRRWWPYVPVFAAVLGPAERVQGRPRYLGTGIAAHVIGTAASQALLARSIARGDEPRKLAHAHDIGVSYFALGVGGGLCGYLPTSWRVGTQLAAATAVAVAVRSRADFTATGHCVAFLVGTLVPARRVTS